MTTWSSKSEPGSADTNDGTAAEPRTVGRSTAAWTEFSSRYDRCFRRVFHYVSRRVGDRAVAQEIVAAVLVENLALLITDHGAEEELMALKLASDRAIASKKLVLTRQQGVARTG